MSQMTFDGVAYQGVVNAAEATAPRHAPETQVAAFVNAVLYCVTGTTGPYGGPYLRELAAIAAVRCTGNSVGGNLDRIMEICSEVVFGTSGQFLGWVASFDNDNADPVDRRMTGRYQRLSAMVKTHDPIGFTSDGVMVFASNRLRTGLTKEVITRALARIQRTVDGPNAVDCGRFVVASQRTARRPEDAVQYVRRGCAWLPVVTGRPKAAASRVVTLVLQRHGDYAVLAAAYAGEPAPPLPEDPAKTPESVPFWRTHALVWDGIASLTGFVPDWAK